MYTKQKSKYTDNNEGKLCTLTSHGAMTPRDCYFLLDFTRLVTRSQSLRRSQGTDLDLMVRDYFQHMFFVKNLSGRRCRFRATVQLQGIS
jgi:hypothetical protein